MNLENLGWNQFFQHNFENHKNDNYIPARVNWQQKNVSHVLCEAGELTAEISGRLRNLAENKSDLPTVGDWVVISPRVNEHKATIHAVMTRKSHFSRKAVLAGGPQYGPGRTEEQILAANIDVAFLVNGLDNDYNLRRIERYLTVAWDSGVKPVVILNKADLCEDIDTVLEEIESVAFGVPVHVVSAEQNSGMESFEEYLNDNQTVVFLGSSGVGKSSLINRMLGEDRLKVNAVREYDNRGRHTTTWRELLVLPQGGIVIDTPGLREIQMWTENEGVSNVFEDIEKLAMNCRFRNCGHTNEPGCAVKQAIDEGLLESKRLRSYLKLLREQKILAVNKNRRARLDTKARWKKITIAMRKNKNNK